MIETCELNGRRPARAALAIALTGILAACASEPPAAPPPAAGAGSGTTAAAVAAPGSGASQTASAKPAKTRKPKIPKNAVPDEAAAIIAGKEACLPVSETYDKEQWRAQNQGGVWRVWVTPVHCVGGGTCPTYETHITAADGVAGGCKQRVTLN